MLSALTDFLSDLFAAGTMPAAAPTKRRARPRARAAQRASEPVEQIALELVDLSDPVVLSEAKDLLVPAAPPPTRDATALFTDLRAFGLTGIATLRLTRNRTVMVSWKGSELRVHQGFAQAPTPILCAIVQFVTARRAADRTAAVRVLRAFELPEQAPRLPRRLSTSPEDRALAERLTTMHARLNTERFGGRLKALDVVVSRRMKTRLGHYALARGGMPGQIAISRRHLRRHRWAQAVETMLHEMVHQWQDELGMPVDHGPAFRRKARELGITPAARRAV